MEEKDNIWEDGGPKNKPDSHDPLEDGEGDEKEEEEEENDVDWDENER